MVMDMMQAPPPPDSGAGAGPPPDLAAALGAGGPPPGAGPPPDLAAALGAPPPGAEPPPDQGAPAQDSAEIVSGMLDQAKQYLDTEQDHEDLLSMQKISTLLQQLLTKDQQDADAAMSGNLKPRTLRKAFAQGSGP